MAPPFSADRYPLGAAGAVLAPMSAADAGAAGRIMTTIIPWSRLGAGEVRIARALAGPAPGARAFALQCDGGLAGAVLVRWPWMAGPYLNILAVFPSHQRKGLGAAVLDWLAAEARAADARNVWLCVSAFNADARRFYEAQGFSAAAELDGLIVDHEDEILMRRRLV